MTAGGYWGRYLRVDLTTGQAAPFPLPEEVLRRYIGGVGVGAWLLLREAPPGVDPLSPQAPLIFSLSPLVGTPLTTSAKFAVVAKSPLTDRINDALSSSHFAIAAKRAGFDALVLVGACREPSVLVIDGEALEKADAGPGRASVTIEDGRDLWGLSASEAEMRLKERLRARGSGSEARYHTAAIGPAGENLVRFATLSNDGRHAGRGGLGAVMGSKRLKALAVRGARFVPLADPKAVYTLAKDLSARSLGPATEKYRELGTVSNLVLFNRLAVLPTRNFQDSTFEAADSLSPERLAAARTMTRSSCAACTIGCEHVYGVRREPADSGAGTQGGAGAAPLSGGGASREGGRAPARAVRMEYESLFALGPLCGVSDPDAVLEAAALCDELGLDTISAGGTIAFAMECAARGLIGKERFPAAPPLEFGNAATVHALLRLIARREGIGDLLAEGSRRAAAAIGGDAPDFAPHVKGLEIPGYEPRALQAMALGFAVGSRGADHNRSSAYEADFSEAGNRMAGDAGTARRAAATEDRAALMDALILCKFLRGVFTDLFQEAVPLLRAVTGWDVTADELRQAARRIVVTRKWFNEREGWTPAEDTLPRRFLSEPLRQGASAGATLSPSRLAEMIEAYNLHRGFTADGHVPEGLRRTFGIEG
ncbi:MAG: aldehyde ferredoxin oxidoreductase family protein [Acidobacteria bacterium]|nr:aldehyde ferredoxin oxidoreductase family protein [Acidobacteriota bacterium]